MEYDFSKIKTEELREAKQKKENGYWNSCAYIECERCPFSLDGEPCGKEDRIKHGKYFDSELNRREKMENKMPAIVSGMVVEIEWSDMDNQKYLIIGDMGYDIEDDGYISDFIENELKTIVNVYEIKEHTTLSRVKDNLKLIWSKKSDKDIKIEELEATIKKAQEQIQELKG